MAEEEVVLQAASPVPSDLKRKLKDLEPTGALPIELPVEGNEEADAENGVAESDSVEVKRLRLEDEKPDELAGENGFQLERSEEQEKEEKAGEAVELNEVNGKAENGENPSEEAEAEVKTEQLEGTEEQREQASADNHGTNGDELVKADDSNADTAQELIEHENTQPSDEDSRQEIDDGSTISRKMEVPSCRVGAVIGKAGDTIRLLQSNSGAKIQVIRDGDVDRNAPTKLVEIVGTLNSVVKAEQLINAVIDESNAGLPPSLATRGLATPPAAAAVDNIEIQVPNDKVGLIIGRGGETIKGLQTRSGARIQMIPQHLPEGEQPKERTVRVTGDWKQIEMARELLNEVMNQAVRISSHSGGFNQQNHRSRGSLGPSHWGSRGHPAQSMPYGYQQRRPYPSQSTRNQAQNYGGYPQQMAPRDNFSSTWDQRPHGMQGIPQQGGGYDYYGRKGASGPTPPPVVPSSQSSYNYGQPQDYANPPFPQAAIQHGYGHGYEAHKYDNHGGHSTQPGYTQQGHQPGFIPQQQYGKPTSYGMPSQEPHSQTYGAPTQPGDTTYPGPTASAQYGSNVPPQQQYPYASGGPVQQTYPSSYGSAPPSDGYSQAPTTTAPGYAQQGTQSVPSYSQPAGQQAPGYAQVGAGGYGQYQYSQQGYTEQPAANNANYGFQAPQDPSYGSAAGSTYGAPPSGQPGYAEPATTQPGYAQPATTQPVYDQSASQPAAYGSAPGVAPVPYGKTVSPQPVYPQYDSAQMYAAPR